MRIGWLLDPRQPGSADVAALLLNEFAEDLAIEWHILHAVGPGLTACTRLRGRYRESPAADLLRHSMSEILLACERRLLKRRADLILKRLDCVKPIPIIRLEVEGGARSCNQLGVADLSEVENRKIRKLNLDLLIIDIPLRGTLATSLPSLTTHGLFLTQYTNLPEGDTRLSSFWSVQNREPSTPFAVEHLQSNGTDPAIRVTGTVSTQASWSTTIVRIRRESAVWISHLLTHYVNFGELPTIVRASVECSVVLSDAPSIADLMLYVYRRAVSIFRSSLRRQQDSSTWNIALAVGAPSIENLRTAVSVPNRQDHYFADPFIYTWQARTICFAEEYSLVEDRARIAAIEVVYNKEIEKLVKQPSFRYLGTVIDEPFNLGYPYVFEYEDQLFLIPDSRSSGSVRLYECVEFPLKWQFRHNLLSGVAAADTVVFHHEEYWWLLTTVCPRGSSELCSTLYIFFADNPLAKIWQPHSMNPVAIDSMNGRNGGFIWRRNTSSELNRVIQRQGYLRYGASIGKAKISILNPSNYEETVSDIALPDQLNVECCHHLSFDGDYSAYDYKHLL